MKASQLFAKVMGEIATSLNGWELGEIDGSGGRLLGPGGARLYIRSNEYEYTPTGRLAISCHFPHALEYGSFHPRDEHGQYIQIDRTCTAAKSPAQIAQYIQRQVLPKYLPLYYKVAQTERAWLERKAQHRRQLEEIANIAQVDIPRKGSDQVRISCGSGSYGYVKVYEDTIRLDVREIPWDIGIAIIKLLTKGL